MLFARRVAVALQTGVQSSSMTSKAIRAVEDFTADLAVPAERQTGM